MRAKDGHRRDNVKRRKVISDAEDCSSYSEEEEKPTKVRAKDGLRRDNVKRHKVISGVQNRSFYSDCSDEEEEKTTKVRAEDGHRRDNVKRHGKFRNDSSRNEDHGSRSRSALVANLIATKSVLLERERASEEVMEQAIQVAILNERNAHLKSRLRTESKEHFDRKLTNNNFNYLYDIHTTFKPQ